MHCAEVTTGMRETARPTKHRPANDEVHADVTTEVELSPTDIEKLKAEVIDGIARALESRAWGPTSAPDFAVGKGVDFYAEVVKFEAELIKQALTLTAGNQRAAARLLGMKASTLCGKIKSYRLDGVSRAA